MSGFAYAVLFKDGTLKVGITKSPNARISEHIRSGKSFGHKLSIFFITEPHESYEDTERKLIVLCGGEFTPVGREYFSGADEKRLASIMRSLGLLVAWGSSISKVAGGFAYVASATPGGDRKDNPAAAMNKIIYHLNKNKEGMSRGVLRNRVKSKHFEQVFDDCMRDTDRFVTWSVDHKQNMMTVTYLALKDGKTQDPLHTS